DRLPARWGRAHRRPRWAAAAGGAQEIRVEEREVAGRPGVGRARPAGFLGTERLQQQRGSLARRALLVASALTHKKIDASPLRGSVQRVPASPATVAIDSRSFSSTLEQEHKVWPKPKRRPQPHRKVRIAPARPILYARDSAQKERRRRTSVYGSARPRRP